MAPGDSVSELKRKVLGSNVSIYEVAKLHVFKLKRPLSFNEEDWLDQLENTLDNDVIKLSSWTITKAEDGWPTDCLHLLLKDKNPGVAHGASGEFFITFLYLHSTCLTHVSL